MESLLWRNNRRHRALLTSYPPGIPAHLHVTVHPKARRRILSLSICSLPLPITSLRVERCSTRTDKTAFSGIRPIQTVSHQQKLISVKMFGTKVVPRPNADRRQIYLQPAEV